MAKATFVLDGETLAQIRRQAERKRKPQSWVVREAIAEYAAREDRLSLDEQRRLLDVLEWARTLPVTGTEADEAREVQAVRDSRRAAGQRRADR